MKRRILGLLTALALCLALLPPTARAEELPYLSVGGTTVTEENKDNILNDGTCSAEYDAATQTFTIQLNNAHLTEPIQQSRDSFHTKIVLTGDNSITITSSSTYAAIFVGQGTLTISGSGSLTINCNVANCSGISLNQQKDPFNGDVTVQNTGKLTINSYVQSIATPGRITIRNADVEACTHSLYNNPTLGGSTAILIENSTVKATASGSAMPISSSNGTITIDHSVVEATNKNANNQGGNAIWAQDSIAIQNSSQVTANAHYCTLLAGSNSSSGTGIVISDSKVTANSAEDSAIYAYQQIDINHSEVHTTACYFGLATYDSYIHIDNNSTVTAESTEDSAIYTDYREIKISGGSEVTADGALGGIFSKGDLIIDADVTAHGGYGGIRSSEALTFTSGTVEATSDSGNGIFSENTIAINGGTIHAKGGSGAPAILAQCGTADPDLILLTLDENLAEVSGGKVMQKLCTLSDEEGEYELFFASFLPADTTEWDGDLDLPLDEVTITAKSAPVPVSSVTLNKTALALTVGGTETLLATVLPGNATDKTVAWSSSDPAVASVENGTVTALAVGTATVTASAGGKSMDCTVTVTEAPAVVPVSGVTLDRTVLSLTAGETEILTATVQPADATDKTVVWSSSDSGVASVDNSGTVTARMAGTAVITASAGGQTASCTVTVAEPVIPVSAVTLDRTALALTAGETGVLTATVLPDGATDKTVAWSSSDPAVASVDASGAVTAHMAGTAVITASAGGQSAGCVVTVTSPAPPVSPVVPVTPVVPNVPSAPSGPSEPSEPSDPGSSGAPAEPDSPDAPATPGPGTPGPAEPGPGTDAPSFTDVAADSWYAPAVSYVAGNGLMSGMGDGSFAPAQPLTRAMLAQILYNHAGRPAAAGSAFTDVAPGAWYESAVGWASARGIVGGFGGGIFGPGRNITREQLAVMLWRYAGMPSAGGELAFDDAADAGSYALEALRWAVGSGILSGKGGGVLDPKGQATRAEAAQMLMGFLEWQRA